jgi:hypothetical protein
VAKSPPPAIAKGSGVFVLCESSRGVRDDSRGVLSKFSQPPLNAVSGVGVAMRIEPRPKAFLTVRSPLG